MVIELSGRPTLGNPDWNPIKFCFWNPASGKILLVESGILGFGIRNPTNNWNPEFNFHWHGLESSTWNPESMAWNPESKTTLDSFTRRESGVQFGPWNDKYDFRPKFHDMKFNYHFTTAILKSQNSVSRNILPIDQVAGLLKSGKKKAVTSILSSKQKWCDIEQDGAI